MKDFCCVMAAALLCISSSFGQLVENTLKLTVSGDDRISVVKGSVKLKEWHEKSFWPIYHNYLQEATGVYSMTYRSLADLADTDASAKEDVAFENAWKLLKYRNQELQLKKKYYREVGAALNGVIALQFLQTEAMMDMQESRGIYTQSDWERYRFQGHLIPDDQVDRAKRNTLAAALEIPTDKRAAFWRLYDEYEEERNALLGDAYSVYTLFASDAADFTPGLAKRLGYDLLHVMEREIRLKERAFLDMRTQVGAVLASRFLAFEDYYSVVSKMYAWTDTP